MNLTPKASFLEQKTHAKAWSDFSISETFRLAATAAMLQTAMDLPTPADMGSAAANEFRMQGARKFLGTLMSLTDVSKPRPRIDQDNLNHAV